MRKRGLWIVTLLAACSLACSQSDQVKARAQAQHAREQADRDLHRAAHDARQGFDRANRAVTQALDDARQQTHQAIRDANRNQRDSGTSSQR